MCSGIVRWPLPHGEVQANVGVFESCSVRGLELPFGETTSTSPPIARLLATLATHAWTAREPGNCSNFVDPSFDGVSIAYF